MKKRILSFAIACLMVASTFIISKPRVDVHAVENPEFIEAVNQWTLPENFRHDTGLESDEKGWPINGNYRLRAYSYNSGAATVNFSSILNPGNKGGTAPGWYLNGGSQTMSTLHDSNGTAIGMKVNPYNVVQAIVFTAPESGIYDFSEVVRQTTFTNAADTHDTTVEWMVVKGGATITTFTPSPTNNSGTLTGTVLLEKGEELIFITRKTNKDLAFSHTSVNGYGSGDYTKKYFNAFIDSIVVRKVASTSVDHSMPLRWNNECETDANGWAIAKQGNWRLTSFNNPSDISTITWWESSQAFNTNASGCPGPWMNNLQNVAGRTGFYLNNGGRWSNGTIFNTGVEGEYLLAIPYGDVFGDKKSNPTALFTAPTTGEYAYAEIMRGVKMTDKDGKAVTVTATVRKNGEVIDSVTISADKPNATNVGTVTLEKGDFLMFVFVLDQRDAKTADHTDFIRIYGIDVALVKDETIPDEHPDVVIPIIFDGTSFTDKFGMVELMGYKNGLYTEDLKIEIKGNEWYVYDTNGTNMWQGGGATQNYQWRGSVTTGALTHIGGHNNLKESGSALVFTAPADGTYKVDAALSSAWFNQTTRKAWSDYIIQKYDGTNYTTVTSTSNENKPDNTVTKFSATVTLSKGEQIIVIRKPSATAVTHNVSSEGTATITITDLEHVCCADTLSDKITGQLPFCAAGVESYYQCYCGKYYADANAETELVDNGHDWDDGFCADCGTECSHEGAQDATCQKESVCPICAKLLATVNKNNHVHPNGAYVSNENGTHRYNRICCDYSDIASEKCTYGTDDICDKCGYDNTILGNATTNKDNAFNNVFNNGNNNVTVIGPADGLNDFATGTEGSNIDGVEYYMFNIHHDENGNVILRHHFLIEVEGVKIYVNGAEKALTAEGNNYYFLDTTPVLGKYDVADSIKVVVGDKTVTYTTSLYSYIKVALADTTGELSLAKIDYLKALYDLNEAAKPAEKTLVAMANQRGDMGTPSRGSKLWIDVYDISTGNMNTPIKSYSVKSSAISGFKYRNVKNYGDVLLIAGGTNGEIISCDTGATVWMTNNAPSNSHSIELMPNGVLAVAGSSGNAVRFFNTNGSDTSSKAEIALTDAHGALWDPEYDVLWVLGSTHLWALDVTLNADGTITVVKNNSLSVEMPMDHGHDLQPYYGHNDKLLITGETMKIYNKNTKEFTDVLDQRSTKAFCVLPNGDFIYMFPDGLHEQWNTTYVNILDAETGEITKIESNQGRFYKCRVWNYNYQ